MLLVVMGSVLRAEECGLVEATKPNAMVGPSVAGRKRKNDAQGNVNNNRSKTYLYVKASKKEFSKSRAHACKR